MIGRTTIDGKTPLGVLELWFKLNTARPAAMTIVARRDPGQGPNAKWFALTTNRNGTEKKFDGTFELLDAMGNVTHVVEFKEGSAQSYRTHVTDDHNKKGGEELIIIAPKFTVKAAGKVAEFSSREYDRR